MQMMTRRDDRRAAVLELLADHLLREGLAGASLRPMAAAAATSDRMLLYYFADKDDLLRAVFGVVAARLQARLDAAGLDPRPRPFATLLAEVWALFRSAEFRPYMALWLELAAAAGRGQEPHRAIGGAIADGFIAWGAERLAVVPGADARAEAALLLATVDGLALLDAAGRGEVAQRALRVP